MTKHRRRRYLPGGVIALFLIVGLVTWRLCCPPALYRATVLPTLGGWRAHAHTMNDRGQIAGLEHVGDDLRLFLWDRENGIRDLGPATGYPVMINNAGQIGATTQFGLKVWQAFLWEPGKGRTMLGTLGGKASSVCAMNNRGQIIGYSNDVTGYLHGFLWDETNGMMQLNVPEGLRCDPRSINDAGQILAMAIKQPLTSSTWLLLDPNRLITVDAVPPDTWPCSVNSRSCMIAVEKPGGLEPHLFFRNEEGIWKRLFPIGVHAQVTGLNEKNQVAYTEFAHNRWRELRDRFFRPRLPTFETVSYLWDPVRGRIPLNRYVRSMCHLIVKDLNNKGCIVGSVVTEDGSTRSILLEPIPERWK